MAKLLSSLANTDRQNWLETTCTGTSEYGPNRPPNWPFPPPPQAQSVPSDLRASEWVAPAATDTQLVSAFGASGPGEPFMVTGATKFQQAAEPTGTKSTYDTKPSPN